MLTQTKDGEAYKTVMKNPWESLNSDTIPEYTIEDISAQTGKCGTTIIIEGYIIDNPERYFNFDTIKDYILWFAAGGSFKTYFENYAELHKYIQNMQIAPRIFLEGRIFGIKEEIAGTHQFSPPQEKPIEDPKEEIYKKSVNYRRHFGPYHRASNIKGEYVSCQIYGTVYGINFYKNKILVKIEYKLSNLFKHDHPYDTFDYVACWNVDLEAHEKKAYRWLQPDINEGGGRVDIEVWSSEGYSCY